MHLSRPARSFVFPLALTAILVLATSARSASGQASADALRAACSPDAARLCSGVQPGGGRVVACLKQHKDELSDACRKAAGLPPKASAAPGQNATPPDSAASGSAMTSTPGSAPAPTSPNAMADNVAMPTHGATPAAIGQPTHVAGEDFVRRPILDTAHGNATVATLHIPQKWSFDSKVEWHYDWIESPLLVSEHAANPANSEAFYAYPILRFESITVAPQYRQYVKSAPTPPGQRMTTGAISMPVQPPVPAMTAFIKQARPNVNIKWVGKQDLPDLAKALNLTPLPGDHGLAIKISYDLDGKPVDEAFFGVYYASSGGNAAVSVGQQHGAANAVQQTNWGFRNLMSFRAPAGTLERRMPVFALIAKSLAMNPQWLQLDKSINDKLQASFDQKLKQGYDQIRASQAAMAQMMAQEKAVDASVNSFDANLRKPFDDSWLRTTGGGSSPGGQLSSTDRASNLLRGEDTVADPNSSTGRSQVSNAGDYHYTNGLGDYRTYSDPNMTPEKAGESGSWTPLTTIQ
jgi:hypothetical protein